MLLNLVLEKTLENPLDSKEIKPVNPQENQSWIFIGRTDAEAEAPILWPPDVKNWLIGKDPDSGKDWRQEKGMTEDGMVVWYHWLNGHEFEQAPGIGGGQGGLVCCGPWGHQGLDMTKQVNNNNTKWTGTPENTCSSAHQASKSVSHEECSLHHTAIFFNHLLDDCWEWLPVSTCKGQRVL